MINAVKTFFKTRPHCWAVVVFPVYLAGFILIEHVKFEQYYVCYLPVDDLIPFCEWFIIPYVLWYPYLAALGFFLLFQKDGEEFYRYMFFVFGSLILCLIFYLIFPNGQNLRPEVLPRDNLAARAVAWIYAADTNTNVLPSMHVLASMEIHAMVLKSRYAFLHKKGIRALSLILAVLISVSIFFVKQHSVLDGIAAILFFIPLYLFFYRFDPVGRVLRRREKTRDL